MYADPGLNKVGSKLNFSSKSVVEKSVESQKLKILLNEKSKKNHKIVFVYVSEHCASFGTKNSIWSLLLLREGGLHVVN